MECLFIQLTRSLMHFSKVDGMTIEEAIEFFEFNTLGTFSGMDNPNKPIFAYDEFIF